MLGLDYSSGEEDQKPQQGTAPTAPIEPETVLDERPIEASAPAIEAPQPKAATPAVRLTPAKLKELRQEIGAAKSATAVVQVARRNIDASWDVRWGAEAMYQVAKRSTARTRKEWPKDATVKHLAEKLCNEASSGDSLTGHGEDDVDVLLVALEALRRLGLQEAEKQKEPLERSIGMLLANNLRHPAKSLARLYWLGANLNLTGWADFSSQLSSEIKARYTELDGPDLGLLLAAMRHQVAKDVALLSKVVIRLKADGIHKLMSATDLVEMSEAMSELAVQDEGALRPLGQDMLRRRGELTPDESHRAHAAFQAMKLPLPKVWAEPGAAKKREGAQIVTTTAFAPQDGHEKKRRGNHDIERTSPPRVVRDYKMMSY